MKNIETNKYVLRPKFLVKREIFALALILLFSSTFAKIPRIDCNLEIKGQEAIASIAINLYSETPINYFSVEMPFQGSRILKIYDSISNIKDYSIRDGKLFVKTNSSAKRTEDVLRIEAVYRGLEKEEFLQARILDFSVAADDNTEVYFNAYGPIYGFDASAGFKGSIKDGKLFLVGSGPLYVRFVYSDTGEKFWRFFVFESGSLSSAHLREVFNKVEDLYFILPNVLGIEPEQDTYAVVVLSDIDYNSRINGYSRGIYLNGGLLVFKESALLDKTAAVPVILHELTHCFNAKALSWNSSKAVWLDEGLAKFVEYLVSRNLGLRTPNLFLGEQSYVEGRYKYTIMPSGDFNELCSYYDRNLTYMYEWNAENPDRRSFGYAFSELFVRDYLLKNGFEKLHYAMRSFLNEKVNVYDSREFTEKVLKKLGTSLEPCKAREKDTMIGCINELNNFLPDIPKANVISTGPQQLQKTADFDISSVRARNIIYKFRELQEKMQQFFESVFDEAGVLLQ